MRVGAEKVGGVNQDFLKVGWGGGYGPGAPPPRSGAPGSAWRHIYESIYFSGHQDMKETSRKLFYNEWATL